MAGKLTYTTADFEKAAIQYRGPLLKLPALSIKDLLVYMTLRLGVRGTELVGQANAKAQLAPYKAGKRQDLNLNLAIRALVTYFGSVNADFEPNAAISTVLGHKASQAMGDAQASTPTALEVLSLIAKGVGEDLRDAIFNGVRNANGATTKDLFDGFCTIIGKEITAGEIAETKGNLKKIAKITKANAVDIFKSALFAMHPVLRREKCFLFCSTALADLYNESYLMSHSGIVYNDKYDQVYVEGSGKRLTIVPVPEMPDDIFFITPKANMLVGMDQMSDEETVRVKEYAPDILTLMMRLFFGVQLESIDQRRLLVCKVETTTTPSTPSGGESGKTEGGTEQGGVI